MAFLITLLRTFKSFINICRHSSFDSLFKSNHFKKNDRLSVIIIGNGPSLKEDLAHLAISEKIDFICVNGFSNSEIFTKLKPKYYCLMDHSYFDHEASEQWSNEREKTFDSLIYQCDWPLILYIPNKFRKSEIISKFFQNSNIKIIFFNSTVVRGLMSFQRFCLQKQLGMLPTWNVLMGALSLAVSLRYKNIFLLGADHSWHESITLSKDGILCVKQVHFYDKQEVELIPICKDAKETEPFTISEIFQRWSDVFKSYDELNKLCIGMNINILNASSKTYIDAFKRIDIKDIYKY